MKVSKADHLLRFGLLLFFLVPYLVFINYYDFTFTVDTRELAGTLQNALMQSATAALVCLVLSVWMSFGILKLPGKLQNICVHLLFIPQILPVLFSILIGFSVLNPFPMGSIGIIFLFILINLGFATVMTHSLLRQKLGHLAVISEVYGLSKAQFLKNVIFKMLWPDLLTNFLIIFVFCFSSFSIPLMAGGGRGANIEVLIYEKIFVDQNWSAAFTLCIIQTLVLFILSYFTSRNKNDSGQLFASGNYIRSSAGLFLIVAYLSVYFGGYFYGLFKSIGYVDFLLQYKFEIIEATIFTTQALVLYLGLNLILAILWVWDYISRKNFNAAINFISVSTVMIGFTFYLVMPLRKDYDLLKIVLAMCLLIFPVLFKIFLQKPIESLKSQIEIAQIYGLSRLSILIDIIYRQIKFSIWLWFSFLTVWFISEFALFRSLGVQSPTLGLVSESFLKSYRLQASYLMSLYILIYWVFMSLCSYLFFKVVYVAYKKFVS